MQSWSYVSSGEKGYVSNETNSDTISKAKNVLMSWDLRTVVSGQEAVENHCFLGQELNYHNNQEIFRKRMPNNPLTHEAPPPPFINSFSLEDERFSSSNNINSRDSSFIDLKLGRFGDPTDVHNPRTSIPSKRMRLGVSSQIAYCQVYGCNKDLSSSKEYHKRHKVCEAHSKTSKVIVNGIEQRFCQQCSRFHLLAEFDDGKRSCRKRLAGHNQRRRKPQVSMHSGRNGKLLQAYKGFPTNKFDGTELTSFICQDLLPTSPLHTEKYQANNWCRSVKVEEGSDFDLLSSIPNTNRHQHSKSPFPSNNLDKSFLTFHNNEATTATGSIFGESTNQYSQDLGGGVNSGSRSMMIEDTSVENENFAAFDSACNVQGLAGITNTTCALSLLSSQSHNLSSHSSGISMPCSFTMTNSSSAHYSVNQVTEKLIGVSSQASTSSAEGSRGLGSILLSDGSDAINFDMTDGIYQGSNFLNSKNRVSCEESNTIDLLQLSSQLERVEREKQSMQVKQENDDFCWPRIT